MYGYLLALMYKGLLYKKIICSSRVYCIRKEFASCGSKFFSYTLVTFSNERKQFWQIVFPWACTHSLQLQEMILAWHDLNSADCTVNLQLQMTSQIIRSRNPLEIKNKSDSEISVDSFFFFWVCSWGIMKKCNVPHSSSSFKRNSTFKYNACTQSS